MHRIYSHEDWRAYFQAELELRRNAEEDFTSRALAVRLGMDPAQLHRIVHGRAPLPFRYVPVIADIFQMDRRAAAYFEELLRCDRARSPEEKTRSRERLSALRGVAARPVEGGQAEFYEHWRHSVIRSLVGLGGVKGDGAGLGTLCIPPVSSDEARQSVELLLELGLAERNEDGRLHLSESHLTTGPDVPAFVVRGFHRQAIDLARAALETIPASERDISAITASLDINGLETLRELAHELRQKVQTLSHGTRDPDRVFQLNIQLFPVGAIATQGSP
jgi:uncharacterized protein (TIGR02147 family)